MRFRKKIKLSNLGEIVGGATPATNIDKYYNGNIAWITPKDLSGFEERYIYRGERNITEEGLKSCSTKLMPKHTILFSSRAPIGYVAIAETELCTNQGFKSIIPNENVHYLFLYYLLKHNKGIIENYASGTTFKEVSGSVMKNIEVYIPEDIKEQQEIAEILNSLDEKIEINRKINDNLAELLQALYQERFGVSEKTIANGHLVGICQYSKAKTSISELSLDNYYSTENMVAGKGGAVQAASLPSIAQTPRCSIGDVLISNIRPYFKKIVYCQKEGGCSTDVLCFEPKSTLLSPYLFSTLYADRFFDFMVSGSKGTKMPRGDKEQIMTYPIYIPKEVELVEFNTLAAPILSQIRLNVEESKLLTDIRDVLLPKLMLGELYISTVQS